MSFDEVLYQTVAARQAQHDSMTWQVPVLSLTAQAFLFTIALGADSTPTSRYFACALSLISSVLSITLMARHRQMDIADADWLEAFERTKAGYQPGDPVPATESKIVSGDHFRGRLREVTGQKVSKGLIGHLVPQLPGYKTWVVGLALFAVTAIVIAVITMVNPSLLSG